MTIFDRYLWKNVLLGVLLAGGGLLTLDLFFSFLGQLDDVAKYADYSTVDALLYLVYTIPRRAYDFFPTAILIGALLGLGGLSGNSEFIAMRAAGMSIWGITLSVLKLGVVLVVIAFMGGQWVIPKADSAASSFRAMKQGKQVALVQEASMWIKEKNQIIHIGKMRDKNNLEAIRIYKMTNQREKLGEFTQIERAEYREAMWHLFNVKVHRYGEKSVDISQQDYKKITTLLNNKILEVASVNPELLSSKQLKQVIRHQEKNGLNTDKYEMAFWKHYSIPLSALVMLILAIPFLFGSQRSGNTGQRIFLGIVVGIVFYLINRALNELGIVYQIQPIVGAFLPLIIFLVMGIVGISRIH